MGVRNLNRFIQHKCPDAASRIHLRDLSGKRVAVDVSIYMYRYSGEGALLENMYLMASVFRHYNIHAVFVFDGPPPPQKTEVIEMRKRKKDAAKKQYDVLDKLSKRRRDAHAPDCEMTTTELDDIEETMRELKKQFVRLRDCDISDVKELLVSFGFAIVDAEGEADALCAKLSLKKRVDACISDDTDMFVYGCPVVLRNLSLLNHSVVSYSMAEILKTLSLTQQEFKMMCVVSGTDYSPSAAAVTASAASAEPSTYMPPDAVFKKLIQFKKLTEKETKIYHESGGGFYDWYTEQQQKTTGTAANSSTITYISNESMFDATSYSSANHQYKQLVILNRSDIHRKRIIEIMMKEDFIFVQSSPSDDAIIESLSSGNGSLSSSPIYGVEQAPDKQASHLATEVYGITVGSFQELRAAFHKKKSRK
jgi:5'-3' exonuclease